MNMRAYSIKSLLLVAFFAFNLDLLAQDHCWVKYNYDAAGNRIKRYWWCGDPNQAEEESGEPKLAMTADFGFGLFPNPAADRVRLMSEEEVIDAQLDVMDLQGRTLHSQRFTGTLVDIDVSRWSAGRYTLRLRTELEEYTTSFSVMH